VASDVLDEAYVRLHHWGPEFGGENGLSNHGPMAVEVLTRRGFDDPALLTAATHCAELIGGG
jgi:hypothetical protein